MIKFGETAARRSFFLVREPQLDHRPHDVCTSATPHLVVMGAGLTPGKIVPDSCLVGGEGQSLKPKLSVELA